MGDILNLIVNAENVRLLVTLVFGFSGFVWLKTSFDKKIGNVEASLNKRIDNVEASLNKRIDNVEASLSKRIDDLKYNDFAHLNGAIGGLTNAIKALTFTLEKNGSLTKDDKEYIDTHLVI